LAYDEEMSTRPQVFVDNLLAGKNAFITGGTSGINLAIAEWLIRSRPKGNTRPAPAAEYLPCP